MAFTLGLPLYILLIQPYSVLTSRVTFNQNTSESEILYYYTRIQAYRDVLGKPEPLKQALLL